MSLFSVGPKQSLEGACSIDPACPNTWNLHKLTKQPWYTCAKTIIRAQWANKEDWYMIVCTGILF